MKYITASLVVTSALFSLTPTVAPAAPVDMETNTQSFSVRLGATRVIYDPASNGTTLSVVNPQGYPILLQSEALSEDMKTRAPFMVTPPLMRLDAEQQGRLRIVRTGGNFATDRESLQWLCAKGIPPKADDAWAKGVGGKSVAPKDKVSMNVQLSINSCIKLFVRPAGVKGSTTDAARNVTWQWQGNKLKGTNNSPFYINLTSLKAGSNSVDMPQYIPPFSSQEYAVKGGKTGGQITWKIINDYGGESPLLQASAQ